MLFSAFQNRSYQQANSEDSRKIESYSNSGSLKTLLAKSDTPSTQKQRIVVLAAFITCITLLIAFASTIERIWVHNKPETSKNCGNSTKEAVSKGCSFDQLTLSWIPPYCPHYANDEFLAAENWTYHTSPGRNGEIVTVENFIQAMDAGKQLWAERREHLTHCVYMFLSVAQIMRDKTAANPKLLEYSHYSHCAKVILADLKQTSNWTYIDTLVTRVQYQSCVAI